MGGIEMGVLSDCLLGGTNVTGVRTDMDGLPVDVDRTEGTFSTKFLPN